ncbi:MAG: sigma-E factor negative regulatory protein [Burkholderiaceae bacterium]|nr:sigma-E factor negative regulatory protein [Burkholderiaceae bacterium]
MNTQIGTHMDQETISALMDGQLRGTDLSAALRGAKTADVHESWLLYHLIGDVLRSAELARGRHDLTFVEQVSQRLKEVVRPEGVNKFGASEQAAVPVVGVMPDTRRHAANDSVMRWKVVAGLATLAAVAAIGWGMLGHDVPAGVEPQQLALAPVVDSAQVVAQAASSTPVVEPTESSAGQPDMWRDPRLDELLAAHRAAAGVSALGSSAGFLRYATFEGTGR